MMTMIDENRGSQLMIFSVTDLKPTDTADSPYYYTFKVQCTSCRETHANWVGVSRHVSLATIQLETSDNEVHSRLRLH